MNANITRVEYKGKEIILIATAHISRESAELVGQVIAQERPDSVCIELDEDRFSNIQNPRAWEDTDIIKVIRSKKVGFLAANLFLSAYQKRIAKKLGVPVGGEIMQGIESAKDVGAGIVLADRKIQITFLRIWRKLGVLEKARLLANLIFSFDDGTDISDKDLQELLHADMLEAFLTDIRKKFPQIGKILISERDQYLASKIKNAPGDKIVAVLGGAHVPGVKKEIFMEQNVEEISAVPPKNPLGKIVGWLIPSAVIALFIYAFFVNAQTGAKQLSAWALWTGVSAGFFTALSLAHPLSILTSVLVAPLTTLNPVLACGWFTGLAEAMLKKPTVQDVQRIPDDIFSFKGFLGNRFLRITLVIFMANVGASVGTFAAGTNLISNLLQPVR